MRLTVRNYVLRRARLGAIAAMTCTLVGALLVRFALPTTYGYDERLICLAAAAAVFVVVRFAIAWTTRCPRCRRSLFRAALGLFGADRHLARCPRCGLDFDTPMPH